jgi:uncharacterized protein (TIGR02594 family)
MICKYFKRKPEPKPKLTKDTPRWYKVAVLELGVKEVRGPENNSRVLEYHRSTSLKAKDDETAWCSSFVNWCLDQCKIKGTRSALARSWLNWGTVLEEPREGCIVVLWRVRINGWQGHVGFYVREDEKHIYVLGGNQDNKVSIKKYPKSRLLGYRWP